MSGVLSALTDMWAPTESYYEHDDDEGNSNNNDDNGIKEGVNKSKINGSFVSSTPSSAFFDTFENERNTNSEVGSSIRRPKNNDVNNDAHRDLKKEEFSEDIYSIIMLINTSSCRIISWMVVAVQMAVYYFVLFNSIDVQDEVNMFQIPPNIDTSTRAAQFIAIIIAVLTQEDGLMAVQLWYDQKKNMQVLQDDENDDTITTEITIPAWKWRLSQWSRAIQGFTGLFVTFILIMQGNEVVDMLLNFTAIEFVSQLDDVIFKLGKEGFFGKRMKQAAEEVNDTYYCVDPNHGGFKKRTSRTLAMLFCATILLIGWGLIFHRQIEGYYSCTSIYVQLGDDVIHGLGIHSGFYEFETRHLTARYVRRSGGQMVAQFNYCEADDAWVFLSYDYDYTEDYDETICDNWIVRSTKSPTFRSNIVEAAQSEWFVRQRDSTNEVIMDHVRLYCSECDEDDFCGNHGTCNEEINRCECETGWYGISCGFLEPCRTIEIDPRFEELPEFSQIYTRLEDTATTTLAEFGVTTTSYVSLYERPVYYFDAGKGNFDLVMYLGRRWLITSSTILGFDDVTTLDDLAYHLQNNFHPYWKNASAVSGYLSSPVDFDTSTDSVNVFELEWSDLDTGLTLNIAQDFRFLCAICNDTTNPCLHEGVCEFSHCSCKHDADGRLCQILPTGNGLCHDYFNMETWNYDQGDCCQATCVSGDFRCGYDENYNFKGYCSCKNPDYSCPNGIPICWMTISEDILGRVNSAESGRSVALSADGRIFAIGEPGDETVRVFRADGSTNRQWGQILRGEPGSRFGESIAISGDGRILVVGSPDLNIPDPVDPTRRTNNYQGGISVFQADSNSWQKLYESPRDRPIHSSLTNGRLGSSLALTQYGRTMFVALPFASSDGVVFLLQWDESLNTYNVSEPIALDKHAENMGKSISISSSGNTVVLEGRVSSSYSNSNNRSDVVLAYRFVPSDESVGMLNQLGSSVDGCCGLISGNGEVLAVSIPGYPTRGQVYRWNQDQGLNGGDWFELGGILNGSVLAVSFDGSEVVLSVDDSLIQSYYWDGQEWRHEGNVTWAEEASVVLLGGNNIKDDIMLVGMPRNNSERGKSSMIQLLDMENCENRSLALPSAFRMELATDSKPNETIWEVREYRTHNILLQGGPYNHEDEQYNLVIREADLSNITDCFEFRIFDLGGDGICCDKGLGSYSLFYGERMVGVGGTFQWSDSVVFGRNGCLNNKCLSKESHFALELTLDSFGEETSWEVATWDGTILFQGGPYGDHDGGEKITENRCLPSNLCYRFTIYDDHGDGICCYNGFGSYTVKWGYDIIGTGGEFLGSESLQFGNCQPSTAPSISPECSHDRPDNLRISVTTDSSPLETTWILLWEGNGEVKGGPYEEVNSTFSQNFCIDMNLCYVFEIFDAGNNGISPPGGYSLFLNGNEIVSGVNFYSSAYHMVGTCDDVAVPVDVIARNSFTCTGGSQNSCISPSECASNGLRIDNTGNGLFEVHLSDGRWTTKGNYLATFGSNCSVACFGCSMSYSQSLRCKEDQTTLSIWFLDWFPDEIHWTITNEDGEILYAGGPYDYAFDTLARIDRNVLMERVCGTIPRDDDECSSYLTFSKHYNAGDDNSVRGLYLYFGNEFLAYIELDNYGISSLVTSENMPPLTVEETDEEVIMQLGSSCSLVSSLKCDGNIIRVQATSSEFRARAWELTNGAGSILMGGGTFNDESLSKTVVTRETCISTNECAVFAISSNAVDTKINYTLYQDDEILYSGTEVGFGHSVRVGNCINVDDNNNISNTSISSSFSSSSSNNNNNSNNSSSSSSSNNNNNNSNPVLNANNNNNINIATNNIHPNHPSYVHDRSPPENNVKRAP